MLKRSSTQLSQPVHASAKGQVSQRLGRQRPQTAWKKTASISSTSLPESALCGAKSSPKIFARAAKARPAARGRATGLTSAPAKIFSSSLAVVAYRSSSGYIRVDLHGDGLADSGSCLIEIIDRIRDLSLQGVIGNGDEMLYSQESM
jgi:hypothetical protein